MRPMTREEIALQIFCSILARTNAVIDIYPELGENQIRTSFALADNFLSISEKENVKFRQPINIPNPNDKQATIKKGG